MHSKVPFHRRKNRTGLLLQIAAAACLITYAGYNVVDMDHQARLHHEASR